MRHDWRSRFPSILMSVLKRILLFLASFLLILVVVGFIWEIRIRQQAHSEREIYELGMKTGLQHGLALALAALTLSALIAFRWTGALIVGIPSLIFWFLAAEKIPKEIPPAVMTEVLAKYGAADLADAATAAPASMEHLVGQRRTLSIPVTVDIPYGKAQITAGTVVEILSVKGDKARVNIPGGRNAEVPLRALR